MPRLGMQLVAVDQRPIDVQQHDASHGGSSKARAA
jgi:hypothetical protein